MSKNWQKSEETKAVFRVNNWNCLGNKNKYHVTHVKGQLPGEVQCKSVIVGLKPDRMTLSKGLFMYLSVVTVSPADYWMVYLLLSLQCQNVISDLKPDRITGCVLLLFLSLCHLLTTDWYIFLYLSLHCQTFISGLKPGTTTQWVVVCWFTYHCVICWLLSDTLTCICHYSVKVWSLD